MYNKYLGLWKFITVILLTTVLMSYGYFQNNQASADDTKNITLFTSAIPKIDVTQANKIQSLFPRNAKINQVYAAPSSIPILMYHEIGDGPNSLYVSEKNFAAQMLYLYYNGYQAVSMAQASKMLAEGHSREKLVILTFDDGYATFYTKVWPILKAYDFHATVFVITGFAGCYSNYLNWDQINELSLNGMEIGCHTKTHPALPTLNAAGLKQQINDAKTLLEEKGLQVESFCYPSGQYNQKAVDQVIKAGFKTAVTTQYGISGNHQSAYLLPRLRISRETSLPDFQNALPPITANRR